MPDPIREYLSERARKGGLALTKEQHSEAGKNGGKARASKLSQKRRSEIARRAARARWNGAEKVKTGSV